MICHGDIDRYRLLFWPGTRRSCRTRESALNARGSGYRAATGCWLLASVYIPCIHAGAKTCLTTAGMQCTYTRVCSESVVPNSLRLASETTGEGRVPIG